MPKTPPSIKERIAFKIGARARKFALEGCPVEGYEVLYAYIAQAEPSDPELHLLLKRELEKYEQRLANLEQEA